MRTALSAVRKPWSLNECHSGKKKKQEKLPFSRVRPAAFSVRVSETRFTVFSGLLCMTTCRLGPTPADSNPPLCTRDICPDAGANCAEESYIWLKTTILTSTTQCAD